MSTTHREFKDRLYAQFARIGKAVGSPHRIEMLELLAQGERAVDSLAAEIGLSLANASQHLQALRQAALVDSRKDGLFVYYRLADPAVFEVCSAIRGVAERRLADLERLVQQHFGDRSQPEPVGMRDLLERVRSSEVLILDARPANEYQAGHIAGAISVPIDELKNRLRSLPTDKEYVAYCRGPYCVYADRAVDLLRKSRRRARRLVEGFPEWRAAGFPIEQGDVPARQARARRLSPIRTRRRRRPSA
jgi:rhodanese-related sulfurtransferase/DNA-binding transcriptional ArsR family regulator